MSNSSNFQPVQNETYDLDKQKLIIEQWKVMIDLADHNSERRIKTNSIYITINTLLTAGTSFFSNSIPVFILSIIGMLISLLWFFSILNYRLTNKHRYKVIRNLENLMICHPITDEYQLLSNIPFYLGNTIIEILIPIVFFIAFLTIILC